MGKIRKNFKGGLRKNNQAVNDFLEVAVGAITKGSEQSMYNLAQRGLHELVNNVAGFSDFTGMLINSYQAAIIRHTPSGRKSPKGISIYTSYGMDGTTPISLKNNKGRVKKRFQRNPLSANFIKDTYLPQKRIVQNKGFGQRLGKLKSHNPNMVGIEVIFNNPTPYAQHVQDFYQDSTVMPYGKVNTIMGGLAQSITTNEIQKAVQKAQGYLKRQMKKK